ncbi:hypothetical protein PLICRDRAFT_340404 [Plicaturopsis crispa FD-325 SS-3]|uniref:Uncharacterized protein n=1 Tax=Plicaturopsis crispa FD-325 SS-3 TaxID=944288 RepID=A0A0C9SRK2_PLICR|nr:hypothetical protein PLICRDRAFT_340404 [Plicaturopsis crispa FD-325 SS-3]
MTQCKLGIALYQLSGTPDYFHWALVVDAANGNFTGSVRIYQITNTQASIGGHNWEPLNMTVSLNRTLRFIGIIEVGKVPWGISDLARWIDTMPVVDPDFPPPGYAWSCAWYILSIIDALHLSLIDAEGLPDIPLVFYQQVRQCGMVLKIMRENIPLPIVRLDGSRIRAH